MHRLSIEPGKLEKLSNEFYMVAFKNQGGCTDAHVPHAFISILFVSVCWKMKNLIIKETIYYSWYRIQWNSQSTAKMKPMIIYKVKMNAVFIIIAQIRDLLTGKTKWTSELFFYYIVLIECVVLMVGSNNRNVHHLKFWTMYVSGSILYYGWSQYP